MRTIKFRIWSSTYGMQYPERYLLSSFDFGVSTEHYIDDSTSFYPMNEDEAILMQYTGLNDKNGKEIYEGDIISHLWQGSCEVFRGLVEFKDGEFFLEGKSSNILFSSSRVLTMNLAEKIIIGNIYETPELIK